ncbi:hypothetical protein V6N11_056181 [Hibiscus sabdariffa]|uniref:Uncharacterized protein n=1 Tax=Hibiscus sabdariffa TaxID=183260 RepID=A0ABR2T3L4_9ROSI
MQGTEVLLATAWLALLFAWPACWVGYLAIDGLVAGAADARCASRGEMVPPLASLNVAALAEKFNFFRPIAIVDVAAGHLAWRPSLFFSWCASMLLSMFRSLCFRARLGLGVPAPCVRAVSLACTSYRGFALMALDGCSCGGCSTAGCVALPSWPCLATWMLLDRIAFSARPHGRLISCFTSYLHWANFSNPCFGLTC